MKYYICADMEGISGITHWDEATKTSPDYKEFQEIFTNEIIATCEALHQSGAKEIYVRDAHYTGRNILLSELSSYVTIIRGWNGNPFEVLQELDDSFEGLIFIGWHVASGSELSLIHI